MVIKKNLPILIRIFSYSILAITFVFLVNNVLTVWFDWPGIKQLYSNYGLFGFKKLSKPLEGSVLTFAFIQLFFYLVSLIIVISSLCLIFFIDLLNFRELSNDVSKTFSLIHQSPQLILVKNGVIIYNASHGDIQATKIKDIVKSK